GVMNLGEARVAASNQRAAFGVNFGARIADFRDGTSNTMVLGEYLRSRGANNDQRGLPWGDQPGYGHIYTQLSPNSTSPDLLYVGWCDNQPSANLPCINGDTGPNNTVAARSQHTRGVNVTLGDGRTGAVGGGAAPYITSGVVRLPVWRRRAPGGGGEVTPFFCCCGGSPGGPAPPSPPAAPATSP